MGHELGALSARASVPPVRCSSPPLPSAVGQGSPALGGPGAANPGHPSGQSIHSEGSL